MQTAGTEAQRTTKQRKNHMKHNTTGIILEIKSVGEITFSDTYAASIAMNPGVRHWCLPDSHHLLLELDPKYGPSFAEGLLNRELGSVPEPIKPEELESRWPGLVWQKSPDPRVSETETV